MVCCCCSALFLLSWLWFLNEILFTKKEKICEGSTRKRKKMNLFSAIDKISISYTKGTNARFFSLKKIKNMGKVKSSCYTNMNP